MGEATELIERAAAGDEQSRNALFASLYQDLRRIAHGRLRRAGHVASLDTTSLVHESYLRLIGAGPLDARSRPQFLAYASQVMRSVVVDLMRESMAARRGGGLLHVTLSTGIADSQGGGDADVVAVDEVLNVLARKDERLVRIVEMKYFAGLPESEIAQALGMSERTVRREWRKARLLLHAALR